MIVDSNDVTLLLLSFGLLEQRSARFPVTEEVTGSNPVQVAMRDAIKNREYRRQWRANLKLRVLKHYGMVCAECGFDDPRALQIDHINDNGAEERMALGGQKFSGSKFYEWLEKQGFPEGYQTLCANHNAIKQYENNKNRKH